MAEEVKKHGIEEGKKNLVEGKPNDVGYVTTKAPVSSADASILKGRKIAPPGQKA
ncbi:MAG: hypothetical protein ACI36V_01710 [Coriobacteriales bacterium]